MSIQNKQRLTVIYHGLYLANLLLLPGFSFCLLLYLFIKNTPCYGWHKIHLYRAMQLSLLAGILLVVVPVIAILMSEQLQASIMIMLVYFITLHALFVLLGMLNIARAMAKKLPIF